MLLIIIWCADCTWSQANYKMNAHLELLLTQLERGLAIYAEQAGEAVHYKYKHTKSRYQRNKYHPNHGKKQVKAVSNWFTWNLISLNKTSIQIYREKRKQ